MGDQKEEKYGVKARLFERLGGCETASPNELQISIEDVALEARRRSEDLEVLLRALEAYEARAKYAGVEVVEE